MRIVVNIPNELIKYIADEAMLNELSEDTIISRAIMLDRFITREVEVPGNRWAVIRKTDNRIRYMKKLSICEAK